MQVDRTTCGRESTPNSSRSGVGSLLSPCDGLLACSTSMIGVVGVWACHSGLSVASNLQKRFQEIGAASRQHADEECLRRKQELEARLVPKTESHYEFELITQRLQEEARHQKQQKEDQIDKKIKEIINQQERVQREKLQKQQLEQQIAEAEKRKNVCSTKADSCWKKLHEILANCPEKSAFLQTTQSQVDQITEKKREIEKILKQCGAAYLAVADRCESINKELEETVVALERDIEKHREAVKAREIKHTEETSVTSLSAPTDSSRIATPAQPVETKESTVQDEYPDCVFNDDLEVYNQLLQELQRYKLTAESFKNDARFKADRFDLQKAVVQPINEISDQSGSHLQDKLDRLKNLLRGNVVTVGTKSVKIPQHAGAFEFCVNLLAMKMVQQAEDQVNVNPKAAFPIAAVIVELWIEFPIFGKLVLGYFYKQCPFLVPYYIAQNEGQTNEEYYKSLGYRYSAEGKVELQPAYLKRMSGIVRLYAAIIMYSPRNNQLHPHGLSVAWHYLSSLLNLPPRNDITASVLAEFLTVAGNAMSKEFGRQFQKMLHFICTEYFTMIRNVTPEGSGGGPNARLEDFLQESIRKGGIPPPAGHLPPRFW
uniref:mRNA export factor GLE1 n=1 Tax=Moina brachiata TaxID=675436 RepID=A0A4Y7NII6_9CRUS|nr:EOG090X0755 [Moina brachiata]SVE93040.1 EOG090X0755 [Moina brachiata]